MAGLFNIFSETENIHPLASNKGSQNLKLAKLKTVETTGSTSAKIISQPHSQNKPKGLSIRSKSDLNVPTSIISGVNKQFSKDCMNIENKINITKKSSCSPTQLKTPKSKSFTNSTAKKLSPKISPTIQNVVDEFEFTKPATPKPLKKYPEPESLANYFDPIKLMDAEMESIFNYDRATIKSVKNNDDSSSSLDDEGFISDPEQDSFSNTLMKHSMPFVDDIDIELPDISDIEE